jgi:hypothetical protein
MTDSPNTMNPRGSPPWRVITHKENEAMHTMNRRALVAGAVTALPAIAVLPAAALGEGNPDAKLLALGVQLEALIAVWMVEAERDRHNLSAFKAKVDKVTGIDSDLVPRPWSRDYIEARKAIAAADVADDDEDEDRWTKFHDRFYPFHDAIMGETAETLDGLAVQARAFTVSANDWWSGCGCGCGGVEERDLQFVEAVLAFLDVAAVSRQVHLALFYDAQLDIGAMS